MADIYVQGSLAFTCSNAEMALIEEAFQACSDLQHGDEPADPTPEFLAAFPPTEADDPWSGLLAIFPDSHFPSFGVEFVGGNTLEQPDVSTVSFWSMTGFEPDAIAQLIHHCCQDTLRKAPIGFEWACSCSCPRVGHFSGGWCAVFADRIEIETTGEVLSLSLSLSLAGRGNHLMGIDLPADDPWAEHPDHPVADWQAEVANDDTRQGYRDWAASRDNDVQTRVRSCPTERCRSGLVGTTR